MLLPPRSNGRASPPTRRGQPTAAPPSQRAPSPATCQQCEPHDREPPSLAKHEAVRRPSGRDDPWSSVSRHPRSSAPETMPCATRPTEQTACQPSDPAPSQGTRDPTSVVDLMEVFAGPMRPMSMSSAVRLCGGRAVAIDKLYGSHMDVLNDECFEGLLNVIRQGCVRLLWLAVPCGSFSAMWAWRKKHPFRSRSEPDGLAAMPARFRSYVAQVGGVVRRAVDLAIAQWAAGGSLVIENPTDFGNPRSPFYAWRAKGHVPIWLTSEMRRLARTVQPSWATTCMCGWLGRFKKPTTLCGAGPLVAPMLIQMQRVQCTHGSHVLNAADVDASGAAVSPSAGEYPPLFCMFWAHWLMSAERPAFMLSQLKPWRPGAGFQIQRAASFIAAAVRRGGSTAGVPLEAREESIAAAVAEAEAQPPEEAPPVQPQWSSAPDAIPSSWDEATDVRGELVERARTRPLEYLSRRRAEPESPEVLARRPLPRPSAAPATQVARRFGRYDFPPSCPPRPIHIAQLHLDGVHEEIRLAIRAVQAACMLGQQGKHVPKVETRVFGTELLAPFARELVDAGGAWDCSDVTDCRPAQPYDEADPVPATVNVNFFAAWAPKLSWPDHDMIRQVCVAGVESGSNCTRATQVRGHHGGLRQQFAHAEKAIADDVANGFVLTGREDPWTVPCIMTARNCVERRIWQLDGDKLTEKVKWRVTTDDSIAEPGHVSRNEGIDPDEWERAGLPSPRTLGEAVAIVKAISRDMGLNLSRLHLEQIALWAIDLTHAYRMLSVQRREWGQQCYVWWDGVRLDLRALFGTASMVEFFERVTVFVLHVAAHRTREYDEQHPHSTARQAWRSWRRAEVGDDACDARFVYLDDAFGLACLDPGEELHGGDPDRCVRLSLHVEPPASQGAAHRVRVAWFIRASRPQVHLAIVRYTFAEAGWGIAVDKVQLGWAIDSLGFTVSAEGEGAMFIPEAKRRGMITEVAAQRVQAGQRTKTVKHAHVERVTGKAVHIATVMHEALPYLAPMYRMKEFRYVVRAQGHRVRVTPTYIDVGIPRGAPLEYQRSLAWLENALRSVPTTPLAPRVHFPALSEPGVSFQFSDAAREHGTGYGAFTFLRVETELQFWYMRPRWEESVRRQLHSNQISMPAGEAVGVVAFADAVARRLRGLTHVVIFTDSSPVVAAINSNNSGSLQLNALIRWLFDEHPFVQFVALHQPGKRNGASDDLSRHDTPRVLQAARDAGARLVELSAHAALPALIDAIAVLPQGR